MYTPKEEDARNTFLIMQHKCIQVHKYLILRIKDNSEFPDFRGVWQYMHHVSNYISQWLLGQGLSINHRNICAMKHAYSYQMR